MIDFHSHLIPGVDDGARDVAEAIGALERLAGEGVQRVVTTPHIDGALAQHPALLQARLAEIDEAWAMLRGALRGREDVPRLDRGAEVKLDTPEPDVTDERLRLAGTSFVLVEFPFMNVPPQSERALGWIREAGYIPIVAHPERYQGVERRLDTIAAWRDVGGYLQVNCGSLLGRYGIGAKRVADEMLARGWVDYLASDYHARGAMSHQDCDAYLRAIGGEEQAVLLLRTNPERLVNDAAPLPVPPLPRKAAFLSRLSGIFR